MLLTPQCLDRQMAVVPARIFSQLFNGCGVIFAVQYGLALARGLLWITKALLMLAHRQGAFSNLTFGDIVEDNIDRVVYTSDEFLEDPGTWRFCHLQRNGLS
jgi:hypothetical protein